MTNTFKIHCEELQGIQTLLKQWLSLKKHICIQAFQSCTTLCNPMDCSPLGSSVLGISQASIWDWVALPSTRGSPQLRDETCISCVGRWILYS